MASIPIRVQLLFSFTHISIPKMLTLWCPLGRIRPMTPVIEKKILYEKSLKLTQIFLQINVTGIILDHTN